MNENVFNFLQRLQQHHHRRRRPSLPGSEQPQQLRKLHQLAFFLKEAQHPREQEDLAREAKSDRKEPLEDQVLREKMAPPEHQEFPVSLETLAPHPMYKNTFRYVHVLRLLVSVVYYFVAYSLLPTTSFGKCRQR